MTTIQVVIGPGQEALYAAATTGLDLLPPAIGGATRQESVRRGLEALAAAAPDLVLIHDAARPLVSSASIDGVIAALGSGADAAVPLLAVADTLRKRKTASGSRCRARDCCARRRRRDSASPQILKAHRDHAAQDVTDDMALAELAGLNIAAVPGEETNMKVTNAEDFALAEGFAVRAARRSTHRIGL